MRGAPRGMQCTLGSEPCSMLRFLTSAAAHGWYGRGVLSVEAILTNSREICVSVHWAPHGGPILIHPHIPERSGLPSPVRGVGAERLGVPSAFFGTSFVA